MVIGFGYESYVGSRLFYVFLTAAVYYYSGGGGEDQVAGSVLSIYFYTYIGVEQ